jgi:release factor glutamine methyltransferase
MGSSATTKGDLSTRVDRPLTARFGELEIAYDARLLAPREWTLAQSDWAVELLPSVPAGPVLELCSGAGHIGLHAVLHCTRSLVCVDDNPVACDFVRVNAEAAGLGERVEVRRGRIDEVLADDERFPLVVADPPWVATEAVGRFPEDPRHAIDGGDDGLALVRDCLAVAAAHLLPGGVLLLQVGPGQEEAVDELAAEHGLALAELRRAGARGALLRLDSTRGRP